MSKEFEYLRITDLRGGMDNTNEPQELEDDQVVYAQNIDWDQGTLGGKRAGCESVTLVGGAVFNRLVPILSAATTGAVTGAAVLSIVVPAYTSDASGTSFTMLVVKLNHKAGATAITAATFGGVAMTLQATVTNGAAGAASIYSFPSPALAGGTVSFTFAANVDAAAICEVWLKTDQITSPITSSGSSVYPNITATTDPTFMVTDVMTKDAGGTSTIGFNQTLTGSTSGGAAIIFGSSQIGTKPSALLDWSLSTSLAWAMVAVELRGVSSDGSIPFISLMRHTVTNNILEDELWGVDVYGRIDRRIAGTWQGGVPQISQFQTCDGASGYDINGISLHGKFYIAMSNGGGRNALMVWDGTYLRWAGFPYMPAPLISSAVDDGAGALTGTRYYRVRYTEQIAGVTVRRSEPNATVTFTPSGAGSGVLFNKPTGSDVYSTTEVFGSPYMNGQTHWELEASIDNVLFYRLATIAIATQFYVDTTAFSTGYSAYPLSDLIGENTAPYSARFVAVDEDRLMLGGSRTLTTLDSRVSWTPVLGATGTGNDERIPLNANFLDLDNLSGGGLQDLVAGESGNVYAFKWARTYKLSRTGVAEQAYAPQTESHSRGCSKRGACSAHDEDGTPAVYFLDPVVGLCRVSKRGIEHLGAGVQATWDSVTMSNPTTAFGPRPLYWEAKHQVWIAYTASGTVNTKFLVFNTQSRGPKGFAIYTSDKLSLGMYAGVMFPDHSTALLYPHWSITNTILTRFTTTAVNDVGTRYRAYWTSKAYIQGGLFGKFGTMAAVLFAQARASTTIGVDLIRNLGQQRLATAATVSIAPAASETYVFKPIDNATLSELFAVQYELGDPASYSGSQLDQTWSLNEFVAKIRSEDEGTS